MKSLPAQEVASEHVTCPSRSILKGGEKNRFTGVQYGLADRMWRFRTAYKEGVARNSR